MLSGDARLAFALLQERAVTIRLEQSRIPRLKAQLEKLTGGLPAADAKLQQLIDETGTELERVLAYYRVSALGEMTESSYRRALEVLNRKVAKQSQENGAHA